MEIPGDRQMAVNKFLYKKMGCFGSMLSEQAGIIFEEIFGNTSAQRGQFYLERVNKIFEEEERRAAEGDAAGPKDRYFLEKSFFILLILKNQNMKRKHYLLIIKVIFTLNLVMLKLLKKIQFS